MPSASSTKNNKTIAILSYGTQGDVEPCIALALALMEAGFGVQLAADKEYESLIQERAIPCLYYELGLKDFFQSEQGKAVLSGTTDRQSRQALNTRFQGAIRRMLDVCWQASQGAAGLIYNGELLPVGFIAEKLAIPSIITSAMPNLSPTRAFPLIGAPRIGMSGFGNRLTYCLYRLSWIYRNPTISQWLRETVQYPIPSRFKNYLYRDGRPIPILYSYSEAILPSPKDWNRDTLASGYWFLEPMNHWKPSPPLERFLADGPAPVYIGFGSTVGTDPEKVTRIATDALRQAGERGVFVGGWGGVKSCDLPDSVYYMDYAPFAWLFPHMKAVVHHGGANTMAWGLMAGKPTIVCPFVTDQFFWSALVPKLGAGPTPLPLKDLSVDALVKAVKTAITDVAMRQRAEAIGARLRDEDGVGKAVRFIQEKFGF